MNPYTSVFDIYANNRVLKEQIKMMENEITQLKELNSKQLRKILVLQEQNDALKETVIARNNEDAVGILDYFHTVRSIRKTALAYGIEMEELYELIPQWEDCRDGLKSADDYKECRIEIIGRREYDEELEENMTKEEYEFRERKLNSDEVRDIISDYKDSSLSMYELADRYELQINYLFKLLKENNVIDKETDAKDYASFYQEHMGSSCQWDGKSDLSLIL